MKRERETDYSSSRQKVGGRREYCLRAPRYSGDPAVGKSGPRRARLTSKLEHACTLIVMAKPPRPHRTKTRLIPALGAWGAAALSKAMLLDVLDQMVRAPVGKRLVAWAAEEPPADILLPDVFSAVLQGSGTLGQRMGALYDSIGPPVLFVGSDAPTLTGEQVGKALELLDDDVDAVFQPAEDGGYTLAAFRTDPTPLLQGIPWGGADVLAATLRAARGARRSVRLMESGRDLDRPEDIAALRRHIALLPPDRIPIRTARQLTRIARRKHAMSIDPGSARSLEETFDRLDPDRIRQLNALADALPRFLEKEDQEQQRYGDAATKVVDELCCAVSYDGQAMDHIPQRILEIDYGCGDPTVYAEEGMSVLDLGSGSGKHAFMIARKVGPKGRVIGIDKTAQMLELSRGAVAEVTAALGYDQANVVFRRGHIEDLRVDLDDLEDYVARHPIASYDDLDDLDRHVAAHPMVADASVDLVVSNCVLNLVRDEAKSQLIREIFRVLKRHGSVAISDIVSDREIPDALKNDLDLWTGCLSGAWRRDRFLDAFAEAGFHGIREESSRLWKTVEGINFFSVTIRAWKGKQGPCYETRRSAMYRGPFSRITDDDGHTYLRGRFHPVCEKTAELLSRPPYADHFVVTKAQVSPDEKIPFDCSGGSTLAGVDRLGYGETECTPGSCC